MAEYEVNTGKLFLTGLLSVILTSAAIVGLQAGYLWYENNLKIAEEESGGPPARLEALLDAGRTRLTDYRVIDAEKGIVAVPIDRAMELVVAEINRSAADEATPVATSEEEKHDDR